MVERGPVQRKLAAILAADVAGYSRLMGADEEGTLARLKALRAELIDPAIAGHHGRIVKTTGDGLLAEFASVVDAMRCATQWQAAMAGRIQPAETRIEFRIGVNLGDVIIDGDDIFGDGVNIAARLETMAEPGGICISRTVLTQTRGKLDFPVEDLGEQALKNIAQPIHVFRVLAEANPMPEPTALPLPDKPSIAVLPFQNMSGDPEQEYFADGMVEEIITALSRIRWLFVIARNSSFTYKGQAVDVKQVGRELGVRYVLEGSVRKGGNRVRITGQLIEAATGVHLWADRFDGMIEDVFELQDQVATSVAGVIGPALQAAEIRRAADRPTSDLTAYDLYLRALPDSARYNKEHSLRALDLFDRVIERDPHYAPALVRASLCQMHLHNGGWTDDPEETRREGIDLARRAVQADNGDSSVLAMAAHAHGYFGGDLSVAMTMIERSLAHNPSDGWGWNSGGWNRLWAGEADAAILHFETALRLSPREPRRQWWLAGIGAAHFTAHRFDEAVEKLLPAADEHPTWPTPFRFLAASYAHMGRIEEARDIVDRLRAVSPQVLSSGQLRNPEHQELLLSGLRLAMGGSA